MKNCEFLSPTNGEEVLVVVMENMDTNSEEQTLKKLHESQCLDHIVLVSSFNEVN